MASDDERKTPELTVVMPAFNEKATIAGTIERVLAAPLDAELIVVDDGSTDGTRALLSARYGKHEGLRLHFLPENRGKGAACRAGFALARGRFVVIQDADAEYDPAELPALVEALREGEADAVFGSRYLEAPPEVLRSWHTRANKLFTGMSNMMTPVKLSDVHTCYKMVRRSLLLELDLSEDGFGMDQELTIKVAHRGRRVVERPIGYVPRNYEAGKKLGVRDAARIAWCIVRYGVPEKLRSR